MQANARRSADSTPSGATEGIHTATSWQINGLDSTRGRPGAYRRYDANAIARHRPDSKRAPGYTPLPASATPLVQRRSRSETAQVSRLPGLSSCRELLFPNHDATEIALHQKCISPSIATTWQRGLLSGQSTPSPRKLRNRQPPPGATISTTIYRVASSFRHQQKGRHDDRRRIFVSQVQFT